MTGKVLVRLHTTNFMRSCGLAAAKLLYEWFCLSICSSVRHTFLAVFLSSCHHEIFRSNYHWQEWCPCKSSRSEVQDQAHRSKQILSQFGHFQFESTDGYKLIHKAWRGIEKVLYCFPSLSVKFQGQMGRKIDDLVQNGEFPHCNSSLNSQIAKKWCTKLNGA